MDTTITYDHIEALRTEAGEHGDFAQVAICDRALGADDPDPQTGDMIDYLRGWNKVATKEAAIRECRRVIAEARAMAQDF